MSNHSIVEFLLARIEEDEEAARHSSEGNIDYLPSAQCRCGRRIHIGVTNPARVLAECKAKRKAIEFHKHLPVLVNEPLRIDIAEPTRVDEFTLRASQRIAYMTTQEYIDRFGTEPAATPIMAALAAVYADHPDYREEWRE